ncbi:MAG: hypothetical protein ABIO55_13560 [Ginsengibacter sp.]
MKPTKTRMLFLANFILAILFSVKSTSLFSQVTGCKDPMANNYNSSATINDGSCTYNPTSYNPVVKVNPMNAVLLESSGLQMAGDFLWSFNDGGGAPAIYNIDTLSSQLFQTVTLGGATNVDWEDIAFDGTYFYVGDFGNNYGGRSDLKIYKFPLSAIPVDYNANPTVTIPSNLIEIISFTYSDQPQPTVPTGSPYTTNFDCEAMIIDNGKIHLFTKNWVDINTTHYEINSLIAGTYVATPLETLPTNYVVTAADKAPGKDIIALLGYQSGNHHMHLLSDYSGGNYFNGNKRTIDLQSAFTMGQAEGITFRSASYGYISNERVVPISVNQKLFSFNVADFIPLYVLPVTLKSFTGNTVNGANKIAWSFNDPVENLQVEYSSNGIDFSILKTYNNSATGLHYNKPLYPVNYYRISWHQNNGAIQYSNIINIKNNVPRTISKFILKKNGELTFSLSGNSTGNYSFKLSGSDGKVLSQISEQSYVPGFNKIYISKKTILNDFVYLTAYSNKQQTTIFLQVEK